MSKTQEFFDTLYDIVQRRDSAALIAQTTCRHMTVISVEEGTIQAIRCNNKVGEAALPVLQTIQIQSFSKKHSCPTGQRDALPLSTAEILRSLTARMSATSSALSHIVLLEEEEAGEAGAEPIQRSVTLKYRGQSFSQEQPGVSPSAQPPATSDISPQEEKTSTNTTPQTYRGVVIN